MTSIRKRKLLTRKEKNSYQKARGLERNEVNTISFKEAMNNVNEDIESLAKRLRNLIALSAEAKENRIKEIENDFVETLTRMTDETALALRNFQKRITR
jgi:DNA-binding ferritin-like protein